MIGNTYLTRILNANHIWLLLDYDGTLADFAPTPDIILPDKTLIDLVDKLAQNPKLTVAIISGRRLSHIEKLLPIEEIWLAGSYGLEIRSPSDEMIFREDLHRIRPVLDCIKPVWTKLIESKDGFYLEDKEWSLALHARFAQKDDASAILEKAGYLAQQFVKEETFTLLGGHKFLEIAPKKADKGLTVKFLLDNYAENQSLPIFFGDDDKDEKAFPVVKAHGGLTGCVTTLARKTNADFTLDSPLETRKWLQNLLNTN
jgi:trehalose-phosphatase